MKRVRPVDENYPTWKTWNLQKKLAKSSFSPPQKSLRISMFSRKEVTTTLWFWWKEKIVVICRPWKIKGWKPKHSHQITLHRIHPGKSSIQTISSPWLWYLVRMGSQWMVQWLISVVIVGTYPKDRVVGRLPNGRTPWLINTGDPSNLRVLGWFCK